MKIVISSYGKENETIGLYKIFGLEYQRLGYKSIINPSYVVDGDGYIYTYEINDGVHLISYSLDNQFNEIDRLSIPGNGVTHLSYSSKHKLLLGCSYGDGTYFSVGVLNGKFNKIHSYDKQIADDRLSRCHAIILNNHETEVAVVNIALDKTYIYNIENGKLVYKDELDYPIGSGPRHSIYSDDDSMLYTITEYSNEIIVHNRKNKEIVQIISTVPNYKEKTYGATLLFSRDRKYLYATNRGEDSIAKFSIGEKLTYVNSYDCGGKHPRHMIITNDGKYIINCNKDSNNVTFFNTETEEIVITIPFYQPTGIVEVKE